MAKSKSPPTAATALVDPPRPSYAAPPAEVVASDNSAFEALREQCHNASYSLLDLRAGKWVLMVFGSGHVVRTFSSLNEGVEFVKDVGITNCRCLHLSEGVIR